jgi:hypothetical protein
MKTRFSFVLMLRFGVAERRQSPTTFGRSLLPPGGAFAPNAAGQYGNAGRDIILGPGFWNLDMGLTRQIPITERQKIEVRAEAFNILNHANFLPSGLHLSYTDGKFGSITSAMDPRILQFALKYVF